MSDLEPSLVNVIDQESLKWIFVGGKGGVGKTTCSCALAVQLAKRRRNVLIISTDPAHNISDAFNQKFSKTPIIVNGFENLYAMEVDGSGFDQGPALNADPAVAGSSAQTEQDSLFSVGKNLIAEMAGGLPGIDEATSFSQMIKLVQSMDFDVVLFEEDLSHFINELIFPDLIEKSLGKLLTLKTQFMPMLSQVGSMFGVNDFSVDQATGKLEDTLSVVRQINAQFKDPNMTTFICVCIAEFLSMYETERLIQALTKQGIDTHNIVVNQLLFPDRDASGKIGCKQCEARVKIQQKYLDQMADLYDDFNVTKLPLLESEVRGPKLIADFSELLIKGSNDAKVEAPN